MSTPDERHADFERRNDEWNRRVEDSLGELEALAEDRKVKVELAPWEVRFLIHATLVPSSDTGFKIREKLRSQLRELGEHEDATIDEMGEWERGGR